MGDDQGTKVKASIDIGSNTVLLLVGEVRGKQVIALNEQQAAPRLGRGVDANNYLHADAVERVIEALLRFRTYLEREYANIEDVKVVATSAVRDAQNREDFVKRVQQKTGFAVQVLSGNEEAQMMYRGAKSVLSRQAQSSTVIDIGGGSTEITAGTGEEFEDFVSLNMGSVRFTERYFNENPPAEDEIHDCREAVKRMLGNLSGRFKAKNNLIGIAGTVTSLAMIDAGIKTYQTEKLNGWELGLSGISQYVSDFSRQSKKKLLDRYPNILKGRAEVILAGLIILETFMDEYDFQTLITSTGGIRHGALLES
jgi:exopolyphosphatase/guanosine-5'-triphosphate,3'-diphosphate pyrophosphatase